MKNLSVLISIFLLSLISCEKGWDYIDTCLSIRIQSKDGTDLLNPASEGAIVPPFIYVYRIADGVKTKQHRGITISQGAMYNLQICTDLAPVKIKNGEFTYVLEYKDRKPDTITGKRHQQGIVTSLKDVKVNGKWFSQDNVLIIKDE